MYTITVIDKYGTPAKNKKVAVRYKGLLSGGFTEVIYTDSRGEAHFDYKDGEGVIYVDGKIKRECYIHGRISPIYLDD